mgnify:CR=1 FL=1
MNVEFSFYDYAIITNTGEISFSCNVLFVLRFGNDEAKFSISLYKLILLEFVNLQAAPADPLDKIESDTSSDGAMLHPIAVNTAPSSVWLSLENDNFWHLDFKVGNNRFGW